MSRHIWKQYIILLIHCGPISGYAEQSEAKPSAYTMNNDRLEQIIRRLDEKAEGQPGIWQFKLIDLSVTIVTDEKADRMRIIIPIVKAEKLNNDYLYRIMQANFDSALDARYAIAKDILWSAYLHPLSTLSDEAFLKAPGQTINIVTTFDSTYSSGLLTFGGGDSKAIKEKNLIEELVARGRAI